MSEIIPEGSVDIHSHILPGLDDGSKNVDQSIALIQGMKNLGFTELIATPHTMTGVWENSSEGIEKSWKTLQEHENEERTFEVRFRIPFGQQFFRAHAKSAPFVFERSDGFGGVVLLSGAHQPV